MYDILPHISDNTISLPFGLHACFFVGLSQPLWMGFEFLNLLNLSHYNYNNNIINTCK